MIDERRQYVATLAGLGSIRFEDAPPGERFNIRVVMEGVEAYLSYDSGIDPAEEIDRLSRKLTRVEEDLERVVSKLASENFISRAPAEIVEKERNKEKELADKRQRFIAQIEALRN